MNSDSDTEKRRDEALRRALNTPPKPKTGSKRGTSQSEKKQDKKAKR